MGGGFDQAEVPKKRQAALLVSGAQLGAVDRGVAVVEGRKG